MTSFGIEWVSSCVFRQQPSYLVRVCQIHDDVDGCGGWVGGWDRTGSCGGKPGKWVSDDDLNDDGTSACIVDEATVFKLF